jgi:hypothetical protein
MLIFKIKKAITKDQAFQKIDQKQFLKLNLIKNKNKNVKTKKK